MHPSTILQWNLAVFSPQSAVGELLIDGLADEGTEGIDEAEGATDEVGALVGRGVRGTGAQLPFQVHSTLLMH